MALHLILSNLNQVTMMKARNIAFVNPSSQISRYHYLQSLFIYSLLPQIRSIFIGWVLHPLISCSLVSLIAMVSLFMMPGVVKTQTALHPELSKILDENGRCSLPALIIWDTKRSCVKCEWVNQKVAKEASEKFGYQVFNFSPGRTRDAGSKTSTCSTDPEIKIT
jgi:hypothetical protein